MSLGARKLALSACGFVFAVAGCGPTGGEAPERNEDASDSRLASESPRAAFIESLRTLCGQAFEGSVTESVPPDPAFEAARLVMHVRSCEGSEIRIPFHVGDDRSRTWVIGIEEDGLHLAHDHRHDDGTHDAVTLYGGGTQGEGSADRQEFPADAYTAGLVPAASTNVWTLAFVPGGSFVYALRREGTERSFRAEFDLANPISPPPLPWGAEVQPSESRAASGQGPTAIDLPAPLARVLRAYEVAWAAGDPDALTALFTEDGFVLRPRHEPVRGHGRIRESYASTGGNLRLFAYGVERSGDLATIVGGYAYGTNDPVGKFVLTLRRGSEGTWRISADIDNGNR